MGIVALSCHESKVSIPSCRTFQCNMTNSESNKEPRIDTLLLEQNTNSLAAKQNVKELNVKELDVKELEAKGNLRVPRNTKRP